MPRCRVRGLPMIRSRKCRFYTIRERSIIFVVVGILLALFITGCIESMERRFYGVKPRVTLEGRPMQGLFADEVRAMAGEMAEKASIKPENARVDKKTGVIVAEKAGYRVDIEETVIRVMTARPNTDVRFVRVRVEPEITASLLASLTQEVGSYATWLIGSWERAENVRLATEAIDNTVILPGQVFSFNDVVGLRTAEKGYRPAPIFVGEAVVPGLGGGICQVSSTLYNVVLEGRLEVVERHAHGLPVSYVPPGRDATVAYPYADFKFRNDRTTPVMIKAVTDGARLSIKIYGVPEDPQISGG